MVCNLAEDVTQPRHFSETNNSCLVHEGDFNEYWWQNLELASSKRHADSELCLCTARPQEQHKSISIL